MQAPSRARELAVVAAWFLMANRMIRDARERG